MELSIEHDAISESSGDQQIPDTSLLCPLNVLLKIEFD